MSVIVISNDSPTFECQSPACYIDAESIAAGFEYDNSYAPSCDVNDLVVTGGGDGSDGAAGADGSDGLSLVTADAGGATVDDAAFLSFAGRAAQQYDSFINTNGGDKVHWVRGATIWANGGTIIGTNGATGATGPTGPTGSTGAAGSNGSNGTDGNTISTVTATPTGGANGDLAIHQTTYDLWEKDTGVWGIIGNILGATGAAGAAGSNGIDGDQWTFGAIVPTSTTVNAFDEYYVLTTNKDVYLKLEGATTWNVVFNLNGDTYKTASTTSVNLTTTVVGDTVVLTVAAGLSYTTGQFVVVANAVGSQFTGTVTTYATTVLTLVVTYIVGTATLASWDVNLAGIVASDITQQWYEITATAGTGAATTRAFTGPSGWTIDTSDVVGATDLGSAATDVTIEHNTGLAVADVTILSFTAGTNRNTVLKGTAAYDTLRESAGLLAVELTSLATIAEPLIIRINLQ